MMSIDEVFKRARRDLFYPPIKFELSNTLRSYFDFSSRKYKIVVSKSQIEFLSDKALLGLFHHELNHWVKHPYDAKTIILEMYWIKDKKNPNIIRNLFDDVVVNLDLIVNKGLTDITNVFKELKPKSKLDNLIRALLSELTGLDFGDFSLDEDLKRRLDKLLEIDFLNTSKTILKKNIKKFAEVVEDIAAYDYPFITFGIEDFPEFEIKRALRDLANELDKDEYVEIIKEFLKEIDKKPTISDGISRDFENPEIEWYKTRAKKYTIYIRSTKKTGSLYPYEIRDFELEDGIDKYIPTESYGKVIPGIAKRYEFEDFEGLTKNLPNVVIVIDSSNSMRNPDKEVSYAVLGAFAIARTYLENGAKVGVVNFSNKNIELLPTRGDIVYRTIKIYQGGGTRLDVKSLENYIKKVRKADYVFITDAGFQNIDEVIDFFSRLKQKVTFIWIKTDVSELDEFKENFKKLKALKNLEIIEIYKEEDIPKIAINSVQN